jgi:hypothetical protein
MTTCPAGLDLDVASINPARLLERVHKHRERGLALGTIGRQSYEHADATHPIGLLRARSKRITGCNTTE